MKRVRVLLANQPRLMRELIMTTIADQPDIELVGEIAAQTNLTDAVEQCRPDVLILTLDERERYRAQCGFLLGRYPELRILALAPHENRAQFFWAIVDIRSKALESSEAALLDAVRQRPSLVGMTEV